MADAAVEEVGDPKLLIITEVFRPYLVDNFHLTSEFLSLLYSKNGVGHETMEYTENLFREESPVSELLSRLARLNSKGTYTAFVECLRRTENGYIADFIEGIQLVDDSEYRALWRHLIQAFHHRLNKLQPVDILPYLHCLTPEEKETVKQTARHNGNTRGAVCLLGIVPKKGKDAFGQLLEGLEGTGMKKLAGELSELSGSSSNFRGHVNSSNMSPTEVDMEDCCASSTFTGVIVDEKNVFEDSTPVENASGCDSSVCEWNLREMDGVSPHSKTPASQDSLDEIQPLRLRGYQEELAAAALQGVNSVIVAPTGSGKTYVAVRLAKAFLDGEPSVGPRTGNPPMVVRSGPNKVVFLVSKVPLVEQQCNVFRKCLSDSNVMGLSGETSDIGSLVDLLEDYDVLVMTPQILVNALQASDREDNQDRMELSKIGLLVFDECHHCQKGNPYNNIMAQYCDLKLSSPETMRPQVLGLTASMGVGKASNTYNAETHILKTCANLDAEALCTVQKPQNIIELRLIRDKPEEEIFVEPGRRNDSFVQEINAIMEKIEAKISQILVGDTSTRKLNWPINRGTQTYEHFLVKLGACFVETVADRDVRRRLTTCKDHLKEYNSSLYINRDARTQDALDHIQRYFESLENATCGFTPDEQQLVDLFKEKSARFQALARSEDPALQNPLLERLAKILTDTLAGRPDSRGILFCKTRVTTEALVAWIKDTPSLRFLQPGRLIGGRGSEGMTQSRQAELLSMFREGKHRLIVATSVAEEGLDIQQCNIVIRHNYVSNEIGTVQSQGRSRARDGKFYLVISEELGLRNSEIRNRIREKLMYKATDSLQKMDRQEFIKKIVRFQEESQLERQVKQRGRAMLEHNRELMSVGLLCRKCSREVCTLDDIRRIQNAHHVVLSDSFMDRCRLIPHDKPVKKVDFEKLKRILCGNPGCPQEWGIEMKFRGCVVYAITPPNFIFHTKTGRRRLFNKWRDVTYKIAEMTMEELSRVTAVEDKEQNLNNGDDEEDEENDEGDSEEKEQEYESIWAPS